MGFPLGYYLAALLTCALTSAVATPIWRAWCTRTGLIDDPGHRKIHDRPIPLAGGLAVCTGLLVPVLAGSLALAWGAVDAGSVSALSHGVDRRATQVLAILIGSVGMVMLGWADDRYELSPGWKFSVQCLIAFLVALSGVRITLFVHSTLFALAVTVVWIVVVTNAVNILDNMNGLCSGLGAIGSACFGLAGAAQGHYLVSLLAFAVCGALLGFLPYNFPKATAFLGDSGSHLTGFLLAVLAILPHFYSAAHPHPAAVLAPVLILAVPLGDLACVILIRRRLGLPIYQADNNHISHRLVRRGWSRVRAVLVIWLLATFTGVFGVWLGL